MNILYLCDEYPPGRHGGIGTLVQLLARQMAKMGHRVVVAGFYSPGYGGADYFEDEGVKVYRFRWGIDGTWFEDHQSLKVRIVRRLLKDTGIAEKQVKKGLQLFKDQLENIINENQIDIVEMPDYNDFTKYCKSLVRFPQLSVPVVVKLNGSVTYFNRETKTGVPSGVFFTEKASIDQADAVSSASDYTARKTAEYFSYKKPIEVLYNGIDLNVPIGPVVKKRRQVIFTGSLMQKKGIYSLARAWNYVAAKFPDARLLILGKGDQQQVCSLLERSVIDTVTFLGHVEKKTLYQYLAESEVSVFPSYAEAFALAPLEAMACGTAVINSNRTSGPELIAHCVDGLLVDPDRPAEITCAIIDLLSIPEMREQFIKKGKEKVRANFEIGHIAQQNLHFYQHVINSRPKH